MGYILQNAIQIFHNGNTVVLNSRLPNNPQVYSYEEGQIWIDGGKREFAGNYEQKKNVQIKNLCLTYDSTMEDFYNKLLWADVQQDQDFKYFKWIFVKDLSPHKLKYILEQNIQLNPYIYKAIKYIYHCKK